MNHYWTLEELKEKILANREIDERTGCWVYTGHWCEEGYGRLNISRIDSVPKKTSIVHRIAAAIWLGMDIASKSIVSHKTDICDHRACFNPDHLRVFASLSEANTVLGGYYRKNPPRGEANHRCAITASLAEDIINLILDGTTNKTIAEFYQVSSQIVVAIKSQRTWKHVWEKVLKIQSNRKKLAKVRQKMEAYNSKRRKNAPGDIPLCDAAGVGSGGSDCIHRDPQPQ